MCHNFTLRITPTNSSKSDTLQVKSLHSCKVRTNNKIILLKNIEIGLLYPMSRIEPTISCADSVTLDSLLRVSDSENDYVTFQTYFLSLLVKKKDE